MPPQKRKPAVADASANEQPSPKRARKPVTETAATTRPKRISSNANERINVTTAKNNARGPKSKTAPSANDADAPRKRGRPPKSRDSTTSTLYSENQGIIYQPLPRSVFTSLLTNKQQRLPNLLLQTLQTSLSAPVVDLLRSSSLRRWSHPLLKLMKTTRSPLQRLEETR